MADNPLKMAQENLSEPQPDYKESEKQSAKARYERLWHVNPGQFNPDRNIREKERIRRTYRLINDHFDLHSLTIADLGCGFGKISKRLIEAGASVHAVDIASNALKHLKDIPNLHLMQDSLPVTKLADGLYDLVICTDVIAHLPIKQHRLLIAEIARLLKPKGFSIISTPLDIYSEDALQTLARLIETEFTVKQWVFSYHYLNLRICSFFSYPARIALSAFDPNIRSQELKKRSGLPLFFYRLVTTKGPSYFFYALSYLTSPIHAFFKQNLRQLNLLESLCKTLFGRKGISHAICLFQLRPLTMDLPEDEQPVERLGKKEVWK